MTRKILFLYTELAAYFLACIRELKNRNTNVHIVRYAVNKEAPFSFDETGNLHFYDRNNYDEKQLIELAKKIKPDAILCCGWIDRAYLRVAKQWHRKIPTILLSDNQWIGTLKQHIAAKLSPFYLLNRFTHIWIPGKPQYRYALKLGFRNDNILTGFYSADFEHFHRIFKNTLEEKKNNFPQRFIFIGRYIQAKAVFDLWNAFIQLQNEHPNNWELWCIGTGELFDKRKLHDKIKHFGFIQPVDMINYLKKCGVFILPSCFEPWGVVVHEMAAAGFPMICSDKVGAASQFLIPDSNGYIFSSGEVGQLKACMQQFVDTGEDKILNMGKKSVALAQKITPQIWADTLMRIFE